MDWKTLLAYITGSVDQELLLRNEFLVTQNRILKNQIKGRLHLTDLERISLAEIGKRLGRRALEEVAQMVRPETILGWHRKLIARKFDGSKRGSVGRPATGQTIEALVIKPRGAPRQRHIRDRAQRRLSRRRRRDGSRPMSRDRWTGEGARSSRRLLSGEKNERCERVGKHQNAFLMAQCGGRSSPRMRRSRAERRIVPWGSGTSLRG